jgi:maleamate amidohydrolase
MSTPYLPLSDRAAGFGQSLPFGKAPALLIVDVCMGYFTDGSPLRLHAEPMLGQTIRLAAAARMAGAPVVFTRVEYTPGGADGGWFYKKLGALTCWDRGNSLAEFHPNLTPEAGDLVVTKQYPSAFFGTSLAATLNTMRVDTVLVSGLSTSGCVRATAMDALCYGFRPFVVADACADRLPATHAQNLFDLQSKYAEVVETDRAVRLLEGTR